MTIRPLVPIPLNDWCGDCEAGADATAASPWSTDSVGFYDQLGQPENTTGDPGRPVYGPYSQFWAGFMSQASIDAAGGTAGSGDPHHMSRTTQFSGGAGYGEVFGPNAQRNAVSDPAVPAQSPLVTDVQSAFADDGTTRTVEFFMTWDQLRWDDNNPTGDADLAGYLATLLGDDGHFRDDVQEDYRFRLDPILVDGDGSFAWGSQGGVAGEDPGGGTDQLEDQANVQLLRTGDLSMDGFVDGLDLGILLGNWGAAAGQLEGNIDGVGVVDGLDLGILLGNWNPPSPLAAAAVPEPSSALLLLTIMGGLMAVRRRRGAPRHRRE